MDTVATIETEHFGTISVRPRNCPLCGRSNADVAPSRYSHRPWMIKDCSRCSFVYIDSTPEYEVQFRTMAWERNRPKSRNSVALRSVPSRTRRVSARASACTSCPSGQCSGTSFGAAGGGGGNVLDLGCGGGQALESFPASFTPFGIEISSEAAAVADGSFRARGGYAINAPCVEGLRHFPENFFAAASLRSYLEHEAEPLPVLENLHRVLAPTGFAVIKVPNYGSFNRSVMGSRWCGFRYPDHLNYFTPKTLGVMAAKAGFHTHFGMTGALPTSDNMWAVLTKRAGGIQSRSAALGPRVVAAAFELEAKAETRLGRLASRVENAPRAALAAFLAIHVMFWGAIPALFQPNLPLDVIEQLEPGGENGNGLISSIRRYQPGRWKSLPCSRARLRPRSVLLSDLWQALLRFF